MAEVATLQLEHDGKSNVLRIRRGDVTGVQSVVVDISKDLPKNQKVIAEVDCFNRHVVKRVAQSTDYVCTHVNCSYHHKFESRYILHARSHFVFEVSPDALYDTEFKCTNGKFTCSKCPRSTTDWISFREHIRHHIFEKPYKCCLCMVAVTSVPELRIHFQKYHVGIQADFLFNGRLYELNTLLTTLLPEASAVREPLNITFKAPENVTTRISCRAVSGKTHSVDLIRRILTDQSHRSAAVGDSSVDKQMPGKYKYSNGMYKCITCSYGTHKETAFSHHAWKHIHGLWASTCAHNTNGTSSGECAIVNALIDMIKRVELTPVIDSSKNNVCETEANAGSRVSKTLENIGHLVSSENDDNGLSQPDAVHDLQPNVTVGTDGSGENIVIKHDQIPLKARCQRCSFTCNNTSQLALHIKTGHESVPLKHGNFRCPACNMITAKKEVLIWHLSHHTGSYSIVYYTCSGCDATKPNASEMKKHIVRKHSDGPSKCNSVALVETVRYLQSIMKCCVCKDGLVWKQIYIDHLRDKHNLSDLASYLDINYTDSCPDLLSFPRHLLKSSANHHADFDSGEAASSETLTVSRFHCENCEFSTNDSDAYWQHRSSHSQTGRESVQKEVSTASSAVATLSTNSLYNSATPDRAAKVKANSQIITPPSSKQKKRNSKQKFKLHRKSVAPKRTISESKEYFQPYCSKTGKGTDRPVVSKKVVPKPLSASDTNFLTEFVSKLPSSYVFAEDIKCPKCFFASRVRVNLLRHINSHAASNNKSVTSTSGTCGSDMHLSYDLWKPDSSVPRQNNAEDEPTVGGRSEVRKKDADDASITSLNRTDDDQERPTTAEADSVSQSELQDSCSVSSVPDISADDANDEMPVLSEILSCEKCLDQFDSDIDLERHISKSHGGPYICPLCGILMWQQNAVRDHYSVVHPRSPVQYEVLHKKAVDSSKKVGGGSKSEKKIARVQGITKGNQLTQSSDTSSQQQLDGVKEPTACTAVAGTGLTPPTTSSAVTSAVALSDASGAAAAVDSSACSLAVTSSSTSQLLSYASSTASTSPTPTSSTLPVSLDSLMAALGSMESIAMIAAQLVPLLANMDTRLLIQMLQVANPAVATALSAYFAQAAAAADPRQMPVTLSQTAAGPMQFPLLNATDGSREAGAVQSQTNASVSSASGSAELRQSADAVRCGSAASFDGFQSSVNSSEALGPSVGNASVPTDTSQSESQSEQIQESPDRRPSPMDVDRPSSTVSTSSSMYSTDRQLGLQDTASPLDGVIYTCHLCAFRSLHRKRFAEHLSSEFCSTNILAMMRQSTDGNPSRRKRCSHCSFSTYISEELDEHVRIHSSSGLYRCTYCDYVGPSLGALKLHFRRSHRNRSFVFDSSMLWQKVRTGHHDSDLSSVPHPQSVHLDPAVEIYNVVTLDHSGIRKLKSQHGINKIYICGL